MERLDFVKTVNDSLNEELFVEMKDALLEKYVPLYATSKDIYNQGFFTEKICDYFKKVEINTGKSFNKLFEQYISDIFSLVDNRIKYQKNNPTRAQKYHRKAADLKKNRQGQEKWWVDFSRIILCLYVATAEKKGEKIDDFEFSLDAINVDDVLQAVQKEKEGQLLKWAKFDTKKPYESDRCTFVILIMVLYYLKSNSIEGEF